MHEPWSALGEKQSTYILGALDVQLHASTFVSCLSISCFWVAVVGMKRWEIPAPLLAHDLFCSPGNKKGGVKHEGPFEFGTSLVIGDRISV